MKSNKPEQHYHVPGPKRPDPHLPVLVRDLMTANPVSVEPTATVKDIAEIMLDRDIRCVPVVDVGELLIGVVSEADLICREGCPSIRSHHLADLVDNAVTEHRHHWKERTKGLSAGEIMTADITTCTPDEPVAIASRRMLKQDLRTLPVTQDRRLVGILSRHDLLRLFDRPDPDVRSGVAAVLDNPLWTPEGHRVQATVIDGVVTLIGSVRYQRDIGVICSVIRQIPGVIEVVSRLADQETHPPSLSAGVPDSS